MNYRQLTWQLWTLGVKLDDPIRASLYIDYLSNAQGYFNKTLQGEVGKDGGLGTATYKFSQKALQSVNLLQELADILDLYVCPAIINELTTNSKYNYSQYFESVIFDSDDKKYLANVEAFRKRNPTTASALAALYDNFTKNISLACKRIYADYKDLTKLYDDLFEDLEITGLSKIKSSGSDFHHGGQQVLILTLAICRTVEDRKIGPYPQYGTLSIIYKPSDMEADCLIAGDSAPLRRVLGSKFMTASLFEIYNDRLQKMKTEDPTFVGAPLSTYRILPRNCTSTYKGGGKLPLHDAYGYVQYLNNDVSGTALNIFGWYPFASSDFIIFHTEDSKAIAAEFYQREGALCAVAGSFSLDDLHLENLRVMSRLPYAIDLEISLTAAVSSIEALSLLGDKGGVTGLKGSGKDYVWEKVAEEATQPGKQVLKQKHISKYLENRLWRINGWGKTEVVAVDQTNLVKGFLNGMKVLRKATPAGDFDAWFDRLPNVLVRYLPQATDTFRNLATQIFIEDVKRYPGSTLKAAQQRQLTFARTLDYEKFAAAGNKAALPNFIVLTSEQSGPDYESLDIPIFYHRIGTTDILNSRGEVAPIPQNVTVADGKWPTTKAAPVLGAQGVLNRDKFFASPPTENVVRKGQVTILGGKGFARRVKMLNKSIDDYFQRVPVAASAQSIVPRRL